MITVQMLDAVEDSWRDVRVVRVGDVLPGVTLPTVFVTVADGEKPLLRVDVYEEGHSPFREAMVWEGWIVIGAGSYIHLVETGGSDKRSVDLGFYFGYLYPAGNRLLVASGDRLFCLTPEAEVAWTSAELGVDGVLVSDIDDGIVNGRGEWDPPGCWLPFQVNLTTGALANGEVIAVEHDR